MAWIAKANFWLQSLIFYELFDERREISEKVRET